MAILPIRSLAGLAGGWPGESAAAATLWLGALSFWAAVRLRDRVAGVAGLPGRSWVAVRLRPGGRGGGFARPVLGSGPAPGTGWPGWRVCPAGPAAVRPGTGWPGWRVCSRPVLGSRPAPGPGCPPGGGRRPVPAPGLVRLLPVRGGPAPFCLGFLFGREGVSGSALGGLSLQFALDHHQLIPLARAPPSGTAGRSRSGCARVPAAAQDPGEPLAVRWCTHIPGRPLRAGGRQHL